MSAAYDPAEYALCAIGRRVHPAPATVQLARLYTATTHPLGMRSRAQFARFFDGFEVIAPGIVFTPAWRPDGSPSPFTDEPERATVLAGVGRKL